MCKNLAASVIFSFILLKCAKMESKEFVGPTEINPYNETCEEFSKFARFNPHSVVNEKWFVFYYWAATKIAETFVFTIPTANDTKNLHNILDNVMETPVNWSAKHVLMWDHQKACSLLTERDDRGAYWLYAIPKYMAKDGKIPAVDVRLKQIGDNLYIGLMFCKELSVYAMAKLSRLPKKSYLQDAAAMLGYRGRGGKSYLNQGHQWMPIPEASEVEYWTQPSLTQIYRYRP